MKFRKGALGSITTLICIVLFCALLQSPASAASVAYSGACGGNATWTLDTAGVLTISGSGKMDNYRVDPNSDYDDIYQPWYSYCASIRSVVIKDGITSIGNYAFQGCSNLVSVSIPNSVTEIGYKTFNGCTALTSVTIPEGVTEIGYKTFNSCTALTSVTIPEGVTEIGYYAFYNTGLVSVTIPDSVSSIGSYAFKFCDHLETVSIGKGVTTIGPQAFGFCKEIKTVYFTGDPPECAEHNVFGTSPQWSAPTVYYPEDNEKWTSDARGNISDTDSWRGYCSHSKITYIDPITATCQTPGRDGYWSCPHCQKLYQDADATTEITLSDVTHSYGQHTMITVAAKDATCTIDGNIEHYSCSTCKKRYQDPDGKTETTWEAVKIAAGHKLTKVAAQEATCTTAGNEEYYTCSGCTDLFKDADGTVKTDLSEVTIAAKGHSFTLQKTTAKRSDATTSAPATYWYLCSDCGTPSDTLYFEYGEPLPIPTETEPTVPETEPVPTETEPTVPETEPVPTETEPTAPEIEPTTAVTEPANTTTPTQPGQAATTSPSGTDHGLWILILILVLFGIVVLVLIRKKIRR